jgi:lysophospholipase L1-like esterase
MKKLLIITAFLSFVISNKLSAQCSERVEPRVLLVGDSWAFFMNVDGTINNAFRNWGHSNYRYITSATVAENGAQTDDFLKPDKQDSIRAMLLRNPSINIVHLSIGGNDVLGDWKKSFTQAQTDTIAAQVEVRLQAVIDFIKSVKPGIKIVWGGYMYTNFEEVLTVGNTLGTNHPFYSTWEKMEFPSNLEINTVQNYFSDLIEASAALDPQLEYVRAPGLMQYTFGQPTNLGIAPNGSYPAFSVPLPNGKPHYPSPRESMRDYFLTKDCFHLSAKGYLDMIEYHTQKFYHKYLMDDLYLLSQNSTQTGTVSSTGSLFPQLYLGESSGENFGVELTFNTPQMLDTTLAMASIFLRRESLTGTNPISGNLQVKVKNGLFGATLDIEASDYNAPGDYTGTPCLFGANTGDGRWIRLDLPVEMFQHIKRNAPTQFLITAPGFTGGRVTFNNSTDPEFAPVLNLKYGTPTVGIRDISKSETALKLYPNPVNDLLQIEFGDNEILRTEVTDILGKSIHVVSNSVGTINTTSLPIGTYILSVVTKEGKATQRFVKE